MTNENTWWRCFSYPELAHICDMTGNDENPPSHDPRIGGDGNVIWQKIGLID